MPLDIKEHRQELIARATKTLEWFDKELAENEWPPFDFNLYELINDLVNELHRTASQESVHEFMNEAMNKFFPRS